MTFEWIKNIYNNPEQSVMESLDSAVVIEDFLPPPSELVKKTQKEKITISIDADCIRFFKIEAEKHNTKYQTMMNESFPNTQGIMLQHECRL